MKKYFLLGALITSSLINPAFSQVKTEQLVQVPNIEVAGFAEMEVVPDEIYFNISLREYFQDEKNQKDKVNISTLEKQLIKAVE